MTLHQARHRRDPAVVIVQARDVAERFAPDEKRVTHLHADFFERLQVVGGNPGQIASRRRTLGPPGDAPSARV